ncbi:MAG: Eco57I restriction-modification methylase domain-containing protein [Candidatus Latescibacteria bacterium]|nr:Eco57I restriction-modification methylase domain-containing protein [Candidatus Latescibacterota bacterium]
MDTSQAVKLVEQLFDHAFDEKRFSQFCVNLFNDFNPAKATAVQTGNYIYEPYRNHVKSFRRIGQYVSPEEDTLDVLAVKVHEGSKLERTRVGLRNFAIEYLKRKGDRDTLLIAFFAEDSSDWRLSYVKLEYKTARDKKGRLKAIREATSARRFSFLVGENEPCHTAKKQFLPLLVESKMNPTIHALEACFNIEKVTKEFFEQYKNLFLSLKEKIDALLEKDKVVASDFSDKNIETSAFAKKLLGQIVFLYFIQKKGWLGVPKDESFGKGDKRFLKSLFEKCDKKRGNYFNDYLEHLFYDALAVQRASADPSYYRPFDCRIPFLNGGLFEPIKDYDWKKTAINLPNELFSNTEITKENDIGTGILDVFDRFNFTVKEDEPLDKEVAVDPEMLGKVFENLLEIKDRKSRGTYYTPREIVHYMCQESLINYLDTAINSGTVSYQEIGSEQLDMLGNNARTQTKLEFEHKDIKISKEDIDAFIKNSHLVVEDNRQKKSRRTWQLPDSIKTHAVLFDRALAEVKVCDPAIGSGAFPVGMLNEIVRARTALTPFLGKKETDEDRTQYHLKRECIQNSLYGVDIDESAIDIAKLRLWLSLVVDEESIQDIEPLPNLDYKVVCGNSLQRIEIDAFNVSLFEELEAKKNEYFGLTDTNEKKEIHNEIDNLINQISNGKKSFDFDIYFSEVWHRPSTETISMNMQISALNKQIDAINVSLQSSLQAEIVRLKFVAAAQQIGIIDNEIRIIKEKINSIFGVVHKVRGNVTREPQNFHYEITAINHSINDLNNKISELNYSLIINNQKGGFDIVIGNPPYIQIQKFSGKKFQDELKNTGFYTFSKTGDIFSLFYEKGINLLSGLGFLCFISNDFTKTKASSSLRKFIKDKTNIISYTDFSSVHVFDATTYPVVLLLSRNIMKIGNFAYVDVGENEWRTRTFVGSNNINAINQNKLLDFNWMLKSGNANEIFNKMQKFHPVRSKFGKCFYGVKTGLNEAFIRDFNNPLNNTKKIFEGKDLKKWQIGKTRKRLILFPNGWTKKKYGNIKEKYAWDNLTKDYPEITNLLEPFEDKAKKRYDKGEFWWELRSCNYYTLFEKPKIIFPNLQIANKFSYDKTGSYINAPAVLIPISETWPLGILNSKPVWFFLKSICVERSGGYIEVKPQYFEQIPFPDIEKPKEKVIGKLVEKILNIPDSNSNAIVQITEAEIDARVAHLYNLTESEYQLILEGTEDTFRITALNYFRDIQKGILQ